MFMCSCLINNVSADIKLCRCRYLNTLSVMFHFFSLITSSAFCLSLTQNWSWWEVWQCVRSLPVRFQQTVLQNHRWHLIFSITHIHTDNLVWLQCCNSHWIFGHYQDIIQLHISCPSDKEEEKSSKDEYESEEREKKDKTPRKMLSRGNTSSLSCFLLWHHDSPAGDFDKWVYDLLNKPPCDESVWRCPVLRLWSYAV